MVATARDFCGNTNICSFTVTVARPVMSNFTASYSANLLVLHWAGGIRQHADTVNGQYIDARGASPPSQTIAATNASGFYRLRCNSP